MLELGWVVIKPRETRSGLGKRGLARHASRRVRHLHPVQLMLANDAVAVAFACGLALASEAGAASLVCRSGARTLG